MVSFEDARKPLIPQDSLEMNYATDTLLAFISLTLFLFFFPPLFSALCHKPNQIYYL